MMDASFREEVDLDGVHFSIAQCPPDLRDEKLRQAVSRTLIAMPLAAVALYAMGRLGWVRPAIPEEHLWLAGMLGVYSIPDVLLRMTVPVLLALVLIRMRQGRSRSQQTAPLSLSFGPRGLAVQGRFLSWDAYTMVLQRNPRRQCSSLHCLSKEGLPSLQLRWLALRTEEHHRVASVIETLQRPHATPSAVPAELKTLRAQLRD